MRADVVRCGEEARENSNGTVTCWLLTICSLLLIALPTFAQTAPPDVGQKAHDFSLRTPEGAEVRLSSLLRQGSVALIVLRGYPGYQCPYCQRQVHDFIHNASGFANAGAVILLVYPGPHADLGQRAQEALAHEPLPANIHLVIDPDYTFTNLYGLRWNAPAETAYPSTFLLNRAGSVFFRKISRSHGDRTTAADVLNQLRAHEPR